MASPNSSILILYGICAVVAFVFLFVRDKVHAQLSIKPLASSIVPLLAVLVPFAALFGFAGFLGATISMTLPAFAVAAVLFFVLARVGLPTILRGIILVSAVVPFMMNVPEESAALAFSAAILGLLAAKVVDTFLLSGDRGLDDVIPPLSLLTGCLWLTTYEDQTQAPLLKGALLGIIAICFVLRVMQRPFMKDDRWLLKRLILSTSGGLGVLIVFTKLLVAPQLATLAALVGAGMFAAYLFKNTDFTCSEERSCGASGVKLLIMIGMLTMVATRFFGMFGLVALAPLGMLAPQFSMGQLPSLFFAVRVMLQAFIALYNSNVTGINITHAYTGAAQYAGFIAVAVLAILMHELKDKRAGLALFLSAAAVLPLASNYYLHAEPTSSFLVAAGVAGVIFGVLTPAFAPADKDIPYENLLIMPGIMAAVGTTYSALLEAGGNATIEYRAQVLAGLLGVAVVLFIAGAVISRKKRAQTPA